jgi:uncharacterized membrane protein
VTAPKKVKAGRKVTITASVANTGNAAASNVKVCISMKKAARLVSGKAKRCRTVVSIEAGKSGVAKFRITTKAITGASARLNYSVSASADGIAKPRARTGHVTLMK